MSAPLLLGASLLAAYLGGRDTSVYAFAKETGLPCDHLLKVIRGKRRRICIDLALDIQKATGGVVPVEAWRMKPSPSLLSDDRRTPNGLTTFTGAEEIGTRCAVAPRRSA